MHMYQRFAHACHVGACMSCRRIHDRRIPHICMHVMYACGSVLQCACIISTQSVGVRCSAHASYLCSQWECVAVRMHHIYAACCSVLQCVAVCCSVLQCASMVSMPKAHPSHTCVYCESLSVSLCLWLSVCVCVCLCVYECACVSVQELQC